MRIQTVLLFAFLVGQAQAADQISNEQLFDYCKAFMAARSLPAIPPQAEATKANRCVAYLAGAGQVYSLTKANCDMSTRSLGTLVEDYVTFTRHLGVLSGPAAVVVHSLFEDCYCGKPKGTVFEKTCPP